LLRVTNKLRQLSHRMQVARHRPLSTPLAYIVNGQHYGWYKRKASANAVSIRHAPR
jgi:hypothetical protein